MGPVKLAVFLIHLQRKILLEFSDLSISEIPSALDRAQGLPQASARFRWRHRRNHERRARCKCSVHRELISDLPV
jgi:hypothetical protein